MSKPFVISFLLFHWIMGVQGQANISSENSALTFFIDSVLPDLPQHDSTLYIQKKSQVGQEWGAFYGLLSKQYLSQSDSIMLKHFNDSINKNSFYWKSSSEMITKPSDQNIINTKSTIKINYLNNPGKFKYLTENDFKKHNNGYYISLMNSVHVNGLSITLVFLTPLRYEYDEPLTYSGDSRSFYIFLNKKNEVIRYYELVYIVADGVINWR